jgi:hypothetical protein
MKDMSRAIRRHHAARLKQARRFYFGMDHRNDARRLGKVLQTAKPCSCWMCGDQRATSGLTRAERLGLARLREVD